MMSSRWRNGDQETDEGRSVGGRMQNENTEIEIRKAIFLSLYISKQTDI